MSNELDISWGDGLYKKKRQYPWIVESVLRSKDVLFIIGREKTGKSILSQQLAFSIVSGEPFLGKYKVPESKNVLLVQTEGKKEETIERIESMSKALKFDKRKFAFLFRKGFYLNFPENRELLERAIDKLPFKPTVLIIDSVYMAMAGDLNDNQDVREFITGISGILEKYEMTCVLLHHESKTVYNDDYQAVEKGDQASFGAAAFNWWIDSILRLRRVKKLSRVLTCNTQRSGKMLDKENLLLIEHPLHYELREDFSDAALKILNIVRVKPGVTKDTLQIETGSAASTVQKAIGELIGAGKIFQKEGGYIIYGTGTEES